MKQGTLRILKIGDVNGRILYFRCGHRLLQFRRYTDSQDSRTCRRPSIIQTQIEVGQRD